MAPTDGFRDGWRGKRCAGCIRRTASLLLFVCMVAGSFLHPARAQRTPGDVTLGLQVGAPGGIAAKVYRTETLAYDGIFTTDGRDFATLRVHRLWERPLPDSLVYLYAGPGLLVETRDLQSSPAPHAGLSAELGLNLYVERFEVFLHITPSVRLVPNQWGSFGGSVGLRYRLP